MPRVTITAIRARAASVIGARSDATSTFEFHVSRDLRLAGYQREFKAIEGRRFAVDIAWPVARLAVEVHGGEWTRGRHTRGGGFGRDCEKGRLLAIAGWRLMAFTATEVRKKPSWCCDEIARALGVG